MAKNVKIWNANIPQEVLKVVNYVTNLDPSLGEPKSSVTYKDVKYFYADKGLKSGSAKTIMSSLSIFNMANDMAQRGVLSKDKIINGIISILLSEQTDEEFVEGFLTKEFREEVEEMVRLAGIGGQTVNATTDFSTIVTTNADFDYNMYYNQFSADDRKQVGYTLLRDGQRLRKEQKGQLFRIVTLSKAVFPVYFATDGSIINKDTITYSRAVNLTCMDVAKEMVKTQDVSKLGANIGWGSLYRYWEKLVPYIQKKNNGTALNLEEWYIPLVTIPRARPCALTKSLAPDSAYLYLIFSMLNDSYLIYKGSIKEPGFTFNTAAKLATNEVEFDPSLLAKIMPKFVDICFSNMRHKSEVPIEIRNAIDTCLAALRTGSYNKADFNDNDYWEN